MRGGWCLGRRMGCRGWLLTSMVRSSWCSCWCRGRLGRMSGRSSGRLWRGRFRRASGRCGSVRMGGYGRLRGWRLDRRGRSGARVRLGARRCFTINGLRFHFDVGAGQKTGAFLDQRVNYAAAARYARGRALDVCTYQGGFALHLGRVCERVTGVDASRAALEVADRNLELNRGVGDGGGRLDRGGCV